jgi:hypothetical protein
MEDYKRVWFKPAELARFPNLTWEWYEPKDLKEFSAYKESILRRLFVESFSKFGEAWNLMNMFGCMFSNKEYGYIAVFEGGPDTGKSTMMMILASILGPSYSAYIHPNDLLGERLFPHSNKHYPVALCNYDFSKEPIQMTPMMVQMGREKTFVDSKGSSFHPFCQIILETTAHIPLLRKFEKETIFITQKIDKSITAVDPMSIEFEDTFRFVKRRKWSAQLDEEIRTAKFKTAFFLLCYQVHHLRVHMEDIAPGRVVKELLVEIKRMCQKYQKHF